MLSTQNLKYTVSAVLIGCLAFFMPAGVSYAEGGHEHHHHGSAPEPTVDMDILPVPLTSGTAATITFQIKDSGGNPVKDLAIVHDRILHVVIIGEDLSTFAHIHPEDFGVVTGDMKEKGSFSVRYTFPKAGKYLIAADFGIRNSHFSEQFSAEVPGETRMAPVVKDLSREKNIGPYSVTLKSDPRRIKAGKWTVITFRIKKDGKALKDIVPYLSAAMHLAIVSSDLNHFIHVHGDVPGSATAESAGHMHHELKDAYGPDIEAGVFFPAKGLYRIFGQFSHEGKVVLLDFMAEAE